MTKYKIQSKNGVDSNVLELPILFGNQSSKLPNGIGYEIKLLRDLQEQKRKLLEYIENWDECPESYRRKLYKRLHHINISKKDACIKLDDIGREVEIVAFNLQLNPTWVRGLLKLIDEILDQTESNQRNRLSVELNTLKEQLGLLKSGCNLYQLQK